MLNEEFKLMVIKIIATGELAIITNTVERSTRNGKYIKYCDGIDSYLLLQGEDYEYLTEYESEKILFDFDKSSFPINFTFNYDGFAAIEAGDHIFKYKQNFDFAICYVQKKNTGDRKWIK